MANNNPKNKLRIAKKVKTPIRLRWWQALVVVAVVALAGYVIIAFSMASDRYYSKTVANGGLQGGSGTTGKSSGTSRSKIVGNSPVFVTYKAEEMSGAKKVCASIGLENNAGGKLTVESGGPVITLSTGSQSTSFGTAYRAGGFNDICQDIDGVFVTIASSYGARVTVSRTNGEIKVKEIWIER